MLRGLAPTVGIVSIGHDVADSWTIGDSYTGLAWQVGAGIRYYAEMGAELIAEATGADR